MVGRRRNIDNDLGSAGQRLLKDGTVRIPDVFADAYTNCCPVHLQHRTALARLKVSEFVENTVIGQIHLVIDRYKLAVLRNSGGVEDIVPTIDESHDYRYFTAPGYDLLKRREIGVDELWFKQ